MHLDDVIFAIEQLLAQNEGGRLYNLCAPIHPKKKDFYSRAAAQLDLTPPEFALEDKPPARDRRSGDLPRSRISLSLS